MRRAGLLLLLVLAACEDETERLRRDAGVVARDARADAAAEDARNEDATAEDAAAEDATAEDAASEDATAEDATAEDAAPRDGGVRGTCVSPNDCNGRPCAAIPDDPDGWHTCLGDPVLEVMSCQPGDMGCCSRADCASPAMSGKCIAGPVWYCGGPPPIPENICIYDECSTTADCTASPQGVCVPARAFGEHAAICAYGDCRYDPDCSDRSGGRCLPFFHPCHQRFRGFYCTYDDSECRSNDDCAATPLGYCEPGTNGAATCQQFIPPP